MDRGKFIVIEGADGVGTTTIVQRLAETLCIKASKEPSDGPIGKLIRTFLRENSDLIPDYSMELLFRADRIEHNKNVIDKTLNDGHALIVDRYYPSTLAYQLAHFVDTVPDIDRYMRERFDSFLYVDQIALPDLIIFLEAGFDTVKNRRVDRDKTIEKYEGDSFQKKVNKLYDIWLLDDYYTDNGNSKIKVVNAESSINEVCRQCKMLIEGVL